MHCYEYGRKHSKDLLKHCLTVNYYKRSLGIKYVFRKKPYIVSTRSSNKLLQNLVKDDYPILFEGIHSCFLLNNKNLENRIKIVRTHNIEHEYYSKLSEIEHNIFKKIYYKIEALKLVNYEKVLYKADRLAAISKNDTIYLQKKYSNAFYIPAFHPNMNIESQTGTGNYIIYHGNLSVVENENAVLFLINSIFSKIDFQCIIAGKNPTNNLVRKVSKFKNIKLEINPNDNEMKELISNAHINILPTFQSTGVKLKLLQSLFIGRHCIANSIMTDNSTLKNLCSIKNIPFEIISEINRLFKIPFDESILKQRKQVLTNEFSNIRNAEKLLKLFK